MTLDELEKGNKIAKEIENCKANIKLANYTQFENVAIRKTYLKVNEESIEVPESLFRVIGKLILAEYNQRLIGLEEELLAIGVTNKT